MGLLDDAIREHLDLKRRRGADPAEIERAEQEALGPVRREPIGPEGGAGEAGPELAAAEPAVPLTEAEAPAAAPAAAPLTGETYGDELGDEPAVDDDEDLDGYEDEYGHDGEVEPDHHDPGPDATAQPAHHDPGPDSAAQPAPPAAPVEPGSPTLPADPDEALGDTASYDLEPPPRRPAGEHGEEDVLEETPEFLQDTPDHDRLWFEQRPPRDFDFDE